MTEIPLYLPEKLNGATLVGNHAPGSPEWHLQRRYAIGGSEVGTILGLNPYESAYALWAKKTGRIPSEIQENWAIRFGKAFEEPILRLWMEEHPEYEVFRTGTYAHEYIQHLHANPDAIARHRETGEMEILEVKTARNTWEQVPAAYTAQVLHYEFVTGIKKGRIIAVAGMTWNEYPVEYNHDMISIQLGALGDFWRCLENDTKPAWDGSEATYQAVRAQYDDIEDYIIDLGELGSELVKAHRNAEQAERQLNEVKSKVLDVMKVAKHGAIVQDGSERIVASRQMRAGKPSLIVKKG